MRPRMTLAAAGLLASGLVIGCLIGTGRPRTIAQERPTALFPVPDTVSAEAREYLQGLPGPAARPVSPAPDDFAAWKKLQAKREAEREPIIKTALKRYEPTVVERKLGGVNVLDIKPKDWKKSEKLLVYTHGGAYTYFGARSSLPTSLVAADATGLRVISIDYTLAPVGKWQKVTDEVLAVFAALAKEGFKLKDIAIYGDSAGGGLAAGAVLKMRDKGLGTPAAAVLWSPWADITNRGDTAITLKQAEPTYNYDTHLKNSADAYAEPKDQKHPYISPVYADYAKGFPPTLIQGGTREIFLSHFVRLYRAMDSAGIPATLDLYEGMTHVFQPNLPDAPEGRAALTKMKTFLEQQLGK